MSKPHTIDLNNGSYIFMFIFLYLSFHVYSASHSGNVCVRRDKSCKSTCGNFTRFDVGMELLLAIPHAVYIANLVTCTLPSGDFFLHYKLLHRLPNSGAMHSFRGDLVAKLAFFTVILRECYEQLISKPFLSGKRQAFVT